MADTSLDAKKVNDSEQSRRAKVLKIIERLKKVYPNAKIELDFKTPLDLLVATMMAAQTRDTLVNTLTPAIFAKYKTPKDYADANPDELYQLISKVSFPGNKVKNIIAAGKVMAEKFDNKVPDNMEDLDSLPGVARKTANVVLADAYHKAEGIIIDTHMIRMSQRLGLTNEKDPEKIEQDLMKIVPKDQWIDFAHMLILHGRHFCTARPHTCEGCPLGDLCPDMKQ